MIVNEGEPKLAHSEPKLVQQNWHFGTKIPKSCHTMLIVDPTLKMFRIMLKTQLILQQNTYKLTWHPMWKVHISN